MSGNEVFVRYFDLRDGDGVYGRVTIANGGSGHFIVATHINVRIGDRIECQQVHTLMMGMPTPLSPRLTRPSYRRERPRRN
jgi:hypothetical protein